MAFLAGSLIFFSPCILPLVPAYISYLTGISFHELAGESPEKKRRQIRMLTAMHAISFVAGFSAIFMFFGIGASFLGKTLYAYQPLLKKAGGILVIIFGLIIIGVIKIPFFTREKKISYKKDAISFTGSFLVGATFAVAWTPCVGPILGSILVYASSSESLLKGAGLLCAFSMGLGLPFILSALVLNTFLAYVKKIEKYLKWVSIIAGVILIGFGIFLITGRGI